MKIHGIIQHMPEVAEYRDSLNSLSDRWNLLTLLGQMSNIGMDMTETREGFQKLTDRLLDRLGHETLVKLTSEMEAKAQVAVDIVIRNLFERTADIGFLATDDDIRRYIREIDKRNQDDAGRLKCKALRDNIVERFREYVAKYSVYSNIILLSPEGRVLAQLDANNDLEMSKDPLIQEAMTTNRDYIEVYRHSDLQTSRENSLIYAYRVTESNEQESMTLGVLCLVFRFENEMEGIFRNLIEESDWMEITLLDRNGVVISSSDPYHIPIGARLQKVLDKDYQLVRFGGREYFAKTCETQGYEGFVGLGWYGHVMVPLDSAFRKTDQANAPRIDEKTMHKVVTASTLFSNDLVDIPRQADRIQRELDVTVWNGNVQIANTKSGDNSFSKSLLNEISKTGVRTKQVFEDSISNLNQTVISSYLDDAAFHAMLAVDIMDRNLYERANDCRWWALTSRFREILAVENVSETDRDTMCGILAYINHLYTVYTNLFIYDGSGTIQAVSKPEARHLIGSKLSESWVTRTLNIHDTQQYSVSPFIPTSLYEGKHTYIYGASIMAPDSSEVRGGIGIVFDSEPQFNAMLKDALPKNKKGEITSGCFGVFTDRKKSIISSTNHNLPIGGTLSINDRFFKLANGEGCSEIIEMDGKYYVVGARMSGGYREYKISDTYNNDIVALVFVEIGESAQTLEINTKGVTYIDFKYPRSQGTEEVVELSTFVVNNRLFAMQSNSIICSLNNQEVTPVVGSDPRCLGIISFMRRSVPVVSLRSELGGREGYDKENDCIIVTNLKHSNSDEEEIVGLVIDRVMDSPEIPRRCLDKCETMLYSSNSLTSYVVQPEQGDERSLMLLVLDMPSIARRILNSGDNSKPGERPLLVSNRQSR